MEIYGNLWLSVGNDVRTVDVPYFVDLLEADCPIHEIQVYHKTAIPYLIKAHSGWPMNISIQCEAP